MSKKGLVSIIVPAYNAESTIGKTVGSLLSQTYSNIEVIVVDDGSLDDTIKVVADIQRIDSRIRYVKCGHHGVSHARNAGIEVANGEWLSFCDADDILDSSAIEYLLEAASDSPIIAAAMEFAYVNSCGEIVRRGVKTLGMTLTIDCSDYKQWFEAMWDSNAVQSSCSKLFNAQFINNPMTSLRFNERLSSYEDLDFVLRCLEFAESFTFVDRPVYQYFIGTSESGSTRFKSDMNDQMEAVSLTLSRFYRDRLGAPEPLLHMRQMMVVAINNVLKSGANRKESRSMLMDLFSRPIFVLSLRSGGLYPNSYSRLLCVAGRFGAYDIVFLLARLRNQIRSRRAY